MTSRPQAQTAELYRPPCLPKQHLFQNEKNISSSCMNELLTWLMRACYVVAVPAILAFASIPVVDGFVLVDCFRCQMVVAAPYCVAPFFVSSSLSSPLASSTSSNFDAEEYLSDSPYYPPLTDLELNNRKAELLLIAKLARGGDQPAIGNFKKHWFSERGEEKMMILLHADFDIGRGPTHWEEARRIFQNDLIRHDPTFLEPQAGYAKLLCLQGQLDESARWAQRVLDSKPWHFVTIETMVAIHTAKGDSILSELWTARRLPNPSQPERRLQWVDRALQDAETILGRMQQQQQREKEK